MSETFEAYINLGADFGGQGRTVIAAKAEGLPVIPVGFLVEDWDWRKATITIELEQ